MKIYISEKDLSPIQINQIKEYGEAAHYFRVDIERYVKIAVSSLEQHEAEIRKQLEDEIESLKNKLADLTEEYELTIEGFDREYAQQNVRLGKAFNEKNSERLKVITELEEWANTIKYTLRQQDITTTETLDILKLEDLKQKLKGMKGE